MEQNTHPTIILVPGAFHKASHFYKLAMQLTISGYTVSILDLPSTTLHEPQVPIYGNDVATIANAIREFTQVGRDVALVMHGYAGVPGTQAASDFARKDAAEGHGAVAKLIYLGAWLPMENQSLDSLPWPSDVELVTVTKAEDDRYILANKPRETIYNGIRDNRVIDSAIPALQSKAVDHDNTGPEKCAWRDISPAYILCEEDRVYPPVVAEAMIQAVRAEGVEVQVRRLKGGNAPFLGNPRETSVAITALL